MSREKRKFWCGEYEGNVSWGLPSGYGFMKYNEGETYIGEWKDGLFNGRGTITSSDGNITLSGHFVNGKKEGTFNVKNKSRGYEGTLSYRDNEIYGDCSIKQEDGLTAKSINQLKYDEGIIYGKVSIPNQGNYEGQLGLTPDKKNYLPQGFGFSTYFYSSTHNAKFVGEWNQGQKNGFGTLIDNYGGGYSGNWKNDQFHGNGRMVLCSDEKKVLTISEIEYFENRELRGKKQHNLYNMKNATVRGMKFPDINNIFPYKDIHMILSAVIYEEETGQIATIDNPPPLIEIDKFITISDLSDDGIEIGKGFVVTFTRDKVRGWHFNFDDLTLVAEESRESPMKFTNRDFEELNPHLDQ